MDVFCNMRLPVRVGTPKMTADFGQLKVNVVAQTRTEK